MLIEYHSKLLTEFHVNSDKGRRWTLTAPFSFSVDGQEYIVPINFWTDFASVPRFVWPVISPYDLGVGPIPHDFGYFTGYKNKAYWDKVLLACAEKDRIAAWRRVSAFYAVDWFGGSTWDRYRKDNTSHQLIRVITSRKMVLPNWDYRKVEKAGVGIPLDKELSWKLRVESLTAA